MADKSKQNINNDPRRYMPGYTPQDTKPKDIKGSKKTKQKQPKTVTSYIILGATIAIYIILLIFSTTYKLGMYLERN